LNHKIQCPIVIFVGVQSLKLFCRCFFLDLWFMLAWDVISFKLFQLYYHSAATSADSFIFFFVQYYQPGRQTCAPKMFCASRM